MKYIACIFLSLSLMAFTSSTENSGPVEDMRHASKDTASDDATAQTEDYTANYSENDGHDDVTSNACCRDLETCSQDSCEASTCTAGTVLEMPAVGLYAPLLEPQKGKMSLAKSKEKQKHKAATNKKSLKK